MIKIIEVGMTVEHEGKVILFQEGDMPKDCVVVFMGKKSWEELKPLIKEANNGR